MRAFEAVAGRGVKGHKSAAAFDLDQVDRRRQCEYGSTENKMKTPAFDHRHQRARFGFLVLAVFVLSLSPLRAFCYPGQATPVSTAAEHQLGHGEGKDDLCCTVTDDRVLINDSVASAPLKTSGAAFFVALSVSALILPGLIFQRARPIGAPPPPHSYYARSARILR